MERHPVSGDPERFLHLASAASDGGEVDWELEAGRCADGKDRRLVRALELLAVVLEEHQRLHGGPSGAAASHPVRSGQHWGPFEIREVIGRGSFATVYRARDPRLDRDVALKVWPAERERADAVVAEARLMARVRHPNVATVYGADVQEGKVGLSMELVEGESLAQLLREKGPWGAQEVVSTGLDLCAALAAVHSSGVVHGDLKTQNVVRERGGRLVLTDFGSGREDSPRPFGAGGRVSGTPLFMAPEVLAGGSSTVRSDLYSLGALLYNLLTGGFPVEAANLQELRAAHARRDARPLRDLRPDLPAGLVEVVTRSLDRDPQARFESAGEFEQALLAARSGARARRERTPARRRMIFGGALVAAALALAVSSVLWQVARNETATSGDRVGAVPLAAQVGAALYRVGAGGDQSLLGGETVRPGDRLYLELRSEGPVSVYVVNLDRQDRGYVLFPVDGAEWSNPLSSRSTYRLPGSAEWRNDSWEVSSAGGQERIIVVASRHRLELLEAALASLRRASADDTAGQAAPGDDVLRGVGRLADAARGTGTGPTAVAAALRELAAGSVSPDDVLVKEFVLENP